jgi:hypothetical protein
MNTDNNKERNLFYLHELSDYKVANSDKDVRGWPLRDKDGITIGKIDNLLISKSDERVVYLDVEADDTIIKANHKPYSKPAHEGVHGFLNKDGENHFIVPVGMVTLHLDDEIVSTPNISYNFFLETKRITKGSLIQRHYETSVLESYERDNDVDFSTSEREDNDAGLYKRKQYSKMHQGSY